jgi:hypothetical protein
VVLNFYHPGYCMDGLDDDRQRLYDADEETEGLKRNVMVG